MAYLIYVMMSDIYTEALMGDAVEVCCRYRGSWDLGEGCGKLGKNGEG